MKRLLFLITLLAVSLTLPAQTNKNIRRLQGERTQLQKKISQSEQLLRSTKRDVRTQMNNLALLNAQIGEQQKYVDGIRSEVSALNVEIAAMQKQLRALRDDLDRCKRSYRRSVNYMFRNRMAYNKLVFIFSAKDFRQMYRRLRYVRDYSKFQRAQGELIARKEAELRKKEQALLATRTQKDRLLAEGRAQQTKLQGQQREREAIVAELGKKQKELQQAVSRQRKQYNALNARIEKLIQQEIAAAERRRKEAEARRRREAERRRKEEEAERRRAARNKGKSKSKSSSSSGRGKTATPRFNEADKVDRKLSSSFAANRGRLPVPITGGYTLSGRFGRNLVTDLSGVQLDNKGVNITGRRGANARAIFDGEVTYIFALSGMYNVIVRHGYYYSLYCNLTSTKVRQGQQVKTGQTLGPIAPDASGNATLHFQLRQEVSGTKTTRLLNPESWLAL